MGYRRIILCSDQEPAIKVLNATVKRESTCEIVCEESAVGKSKSLGSVNIHIQCIQGQVRTLRDVLESRYSVRLAAESPMIPWMIMHVAGILNILRLGMDGHTAYHRVKGRAFTKALAEFGDAYGSSSQIQWASTGQM